MGWHPSRENERVRDVQNSWMYCPLFLDACGILNEESCLAWRNHRLSRDWWHDAVETLRNAVPLSRNALTES